MMCFWMKLVLPIGIKLHGSGSQDEQRVVLDTLAEMFAE